MLRLASWNANGLGDAKPGLLSVLDELHGHHIIAISESRRQLPPPDYICRPDAYESLHLPAPQGRNGQGMLVLWAKVLAPHVSVAMRSRSGGGAYQCVWLRVAQDATGLGRPLFVGAVYMTPESSQSHDGDPSRAAGRLRAHAAAFCRQGHVIIMGDLNARIGSEDEPPPADGALLLASRPAMRRPRASADGQTNRLGRLLLDTCGDLGLEVLTGRIPGDRHPAAAASCDDASRPDHFIATAPIAGRCHAARDGVVRRVGYGASDHAVLAINVQLGGLRRAEQGALAAGAVAVAPAPAPVAQSQPLAGAATAAAAGAAATASQLRWCPAQQPAYVAEIQERLPAATAAVRAAVEAGDVQAAASVVERLVRDAARAADMAERDGAAPRQRPRARGRPGQPAAWFDEECADMRARLREATRDGTAAHALRAMRRAFNSAARRKQRRFRHVKSVAALEKLKHQPRRFWRGFGAAKAGLPPGLNDAAAAGAYFQRIFEPDAGRRPAPDLPTLRNWLATHCRSQSAGTAADDAYLNAPLIDADVEVSISKLQSQVAPGPQGIPNEFFKYARFRERLPDGKLGPLRYLFPSILCDLFNGCLERRAVPAPWLVTAIRPVPKVPLPASLDDTRPIAVGSSLPKLFAATLNDRLVRWAEHHGKHAAQQAGFRPRLSTTHHLFALRHLIDWHRHVKGGPPLYLAFVDFRKAYDSVNRTLLWTKLEHLGVRGNMLGTLQALYAADSAYVQLDGSGGRSDTFPCRCGVKQGCPLSPTLFSLFFDHIVDYLRLPQRWEQTPAVPGAGALNSLLFADDVVVAANSERDLNQLMKRLATFCDDWDMTVNTDKTKVMLVGGTAHERRLARSGQRAIRFRQRTLEYVRQYKYLGIVVDSARGFSGVMATRAAAAERAAHAMQGRVAQSDLWGSLDLRLRLFDVLVTPVADYGAAAWTPAAALVPHATPPTTGNTLERVHRRFLLQLLRLPTSTPAWPLYEECGRQPWPTRWLAAVVKLWNDTAIPPPAPPAAAAAATGPPPLEPTRRAGGALTLHRAIMAHNVEMATARGHDTNWAAGLRSALSAILPDNDWAGHLSAGEKIDASEVSAAFRRSLHAQAYGAAGADPRQPGCPRRQHAMYAAWCRRADDPKLSRQEDVRHNSYLCCGDVTVAQARQVARVRLGRHPAIPAHLQYDAAPQPLPTGPPAPVVPCERCSSGLPGDTLHVLWECAATAAVREDPGYRPLVVSSLAHAAGPMTGLTHYADQAAACRFTLGCISSYAHRP